MSCRNPSPGEGFNLLFNSMVLWSLVKHLLTTVFLLASSLFGFRISPLICSDSCFSNASFMTLALFVYFSDPECPFLLEKNLIITLRSIDCWPAGYMSLFLVLWGVGQVPLTFLPDIVKAQPNDNKKPTLSFLASRDHGNRYSKG